MQSSSIVSPISYTLSRLTSRSGTSGFHSCFPHIDESMTSRSSSSAPPSLSEYIDSHVGDTIAIWSKVRCWSSYTEKLQKEQQARIELLEKALSETAELLKDTRKHLRSVEDNLSATRNLSNRAIKKARLAHCRIDTKEIPDPNDVPDDKIYSPGPLESPEPFLDYHRRLEYGKQEGSSSKPIEVADEAKPIPDPTPKIVLKFVEILD